MDTHGSCMKQLHSTLLGSEMYLLGGLGRLLLLLQEARQLESLIVAQQRLADLWREQVAQRAEDGAAHHQPREKTAAGVALRPAGD